MSFHASEGDLILGKYVTSLASFLTNQYFFADADGSVFWEYFRWALCWTTIVSFEHCGELQL